MIVNTVYVFERPKLTNFFFKKKFGKWGHLKRLKHGGTEPKPRSMNHFLNFKTKKKVDEQTRNNALFDR